MRIIFTAGWMLSCILSVSSAQEAAPTASGVPNEGKQDLSAGTSQTGSVNQHSPNLLSDIKGADVFGSSGDKLGSLADVMIDEAGAIIGLAIETGALGQSRHFLKLRELPMDKLQLDIDADRLSNLPTADAQPAKGSTASLIGADIDGIDNASIADIRFSPGAIDRVIIDTGSDTGHAKIVEVPYSALAVTQGDGEPKVSLTDDGRSRLGQPIESAR